MEQLDGMLFAKNRDTENAIFQIFDAIGGHSPQF